MGRCGDPIVAAAAVLMSSATGSDAQEIRRGHMRLSRCIFTLGAGLGFALMLTWGSAKFAKADCGDGVTTVGEACDAGTAVCQPMSKKAGSECCTEADCGGPLVTGGVTILLCGATGGSTNNGVGNRDDVPGACRCNCMKPMCGDGVSDPGEQCDPGSSTSTSGPCLGNAPGTVCANGLGLCHGGGGNPNALVGCTNDGQCASFPGCGGTCTGNPQCQLAQCGDTFVCSDASCLSGFSPLSPGVPSPEVCDDGNTSNMDSCMPFGFMAVAGGSPAIPDQCFPNACGDGATNMGAEECDAGTALCISGPKATTPPSKPCCTNEDCNLGSVTTGICSNAVAPGNSNNPATSVTTCRCSCQFPFCGDGVSDSALGEQCDDGTTANGPGHYCNKVRRCVGGENPGALCTDNSTCIKGTCGPTLCEQNFCGDDVVGGMEQCDDSNTVTGSGTDNCGVNATVAAGINAVLKPGCVVRDGTPAENLPDSCIAANCILGLCGDGVTEPGEMCDGGFAACSQSVADANCVADGLAPGCVTVFNAGALCCQASDCKTSKPANGDAISACSSSVVPGQNANDLPNHCRCNCMPPSCGDGVSDAGEQCEPPASGTFCIKNAMGMCVLNTCGDDDVCNKTATDIFGVQHPCTTGPGGGNEQCDDSNTIDPTSTNTDTCFSPGTAVQIPINGVLTNAACGAATCGDGVTEAGEQCDSPGMGCSNMLLATEGTPDCCIDGEVVGPAKQIAAGLISVDAGLNGLDCRMANLIGAAACDKWLQKGFMQVQKKITAAEVQLENDNITKAQRLLGASVRKLNTLTNRLARVTAPGKACASSKTSLSEQKANAVALASGVQTHLTEEVAIGFGP
jgi:hypothetical protein